MDFFLPQIGEQLSCRTVLSFSLIFAYFLWIFTHFYNFLHFGGWFPKNLRIWSENLRKWSKNLRIYAVREESLMVFDWFSPPTASPNHPILTLPKPLKPPKSTPPAIELLSKGAKFFWGENPHSYPPNQHFICNYLLKKHLHQFRQATGKSLFYAYYLFWLKFSFTTLR